jgi:dihydropteroate synthase
MSAPVIWKTSKRSFNTSERLLVMGILNVTPDSFSDGGRFLKPDDALRRAERMIEDGADILDIGGESTRPGSERVSAEEEMARVVPVIEAIAKSFDAAVSIDTSKAEVARAAVAAGAEIINDISGLRFDVNIADAAADTGSGLVLMHSRGEFETMHSQHPVDDIRSEVTGDLRRSTKIALDRGVRQEQMVLDIGIGFGKTLEQNLELIAKLDKLIAEFPGYPMLVGTSRKSFIGKLLGGASPYERLNGSLATAAIALWNGAGIVRVHDVRQTVEVNKIITALKQAAA